MTRIKKRENTEDTITPRLMERVQHRPYGCWVWQGSFNGSGTPQANLRLNNRDNVINPRAFLYNRLYGMELGYTYASRCKDDRCVNPTHHYRLTVEEYWRANTYEHPNGCVEWMGKRNNKGYGVANHVDIGPTNTLAHRFAFFQKHGRYPDPMGLHTCDNPWCVNGDHIFEGTAQDNTADMIAKGRHVSGFKRRKVS